MTEALSKILPRRPARFEAPTFAIASLTNVLTVLGLILMSVAISLLVRPSHKILDRFAFAFRQPKFLTHLRCIDRLPELSAVFRLMVSSCEIVVESLSTAQK